MQQKKNWFLRKTDGSEYGPVSLSDLQRWSAQCRIIAGNAVSSDREEWVPVESLPELQMDWVAQRADGKEYGPFALEAVQELYDHSVLPADAVLVNRRNGASKPLAEVIAAPAAVAPDTAKTAPPEPRSGDLVNTTATATEPVAGAADADMETTPEAEDENAPIAEETDSAPPAGEIAVTGAASRREKGRPREPKSRTRAARQSAQPEQPELPVAGSGSATDSTAESAIPAADESRGQEDQTNADDAGLKQALAECTQLRRRESEEFSRERESLRRQIESLQRSLATTQNEAAALTTGHADQCQALQAERDRALQAAHEAATRLKTMEAERRNAIQETSDDLSDLRKQTAFMKKNIAVLHAELEAARGQSRRRGKILLTLGAVLTIAAAIQIVRIAGGGCRRSRASAPTPAQSSRQTASGVTRESGTPGVIPPAGPRAERPSATVAPVPGSRPAWPALQAEGVRIAEERNTLVIRFDDGIFSSLATLSPEGTARLRALAAQLRPHMDRFRLVVEGHTDDTPMRPTAAFADNQALATARAEAVASALRRVGGLPPEAVAVATSPGPPPFPNDSPQNRRRNRTAVLRLTAR